MKKIILVISILIAIIFTAIITYNITAMNVISNLEIDYTNNNDIAVTYDGETEIYNIPFQN